MNPSEATLQALLAQLDASLSDTRLSDPEKQALSEALRESPVPEEGLRRLRNQAFEMVRERMGEPGNADPQALLRWVEGVVRVLDASRSAAGGYRAQAWFSPGQDCLRAIQGQLRACRQQADICVFTLSDDRISAEVLVAHRRGVAVRVLTDNDKLFDDGSDVRSLASAGVPVRVDNTAAHMHHKFALFDRRWLLNGSYNWTRSAAERNEENIVLCNDTSLLRQFQTMFDRLWDGLDPL
jgi:phosphatidylserine/phosphatidylglycerophosphate/cardiolipin synthase-like enzyme